MNKNTEKNQLKATTGAGYLSKIAESSNHSCDSTLCPTGH